MTILEFQGCRTAFQLILLRFCCLFWFRFYYESTFFFLSGWDCTLVWRMRTNKDNLPFSFSQVIAYWQKAPDAKTVLVSITNAIAMTDTEAADVPHRVTILLILLCGSLNVSSVRDSILNHLLILFKEIDKAIFVFRRPKGTSNQ